MDINTDYHQFSFERPPTKLSELQFTPIERRSFFSQRDATQPPHRPIKKSPHYQNKHIDNSPVTSNNFSPEARSLVLPPNLYLDSNPIIGLDNTSLKRKLLFFAICSFGLTLAELIVGFIANSVCLMIDSLRIFYIFKAFLVPYIGIRTHEFTGSKLFTFGYQRLEVLISLILIVFQWGLLIGLVVEASKRWWLMNLDLSKEIMLITAFVGLVCNLVLRKTLSFLKSQEEFQNLKKAEVIQDQEANNSCIFYKHNNEDNTDTIISYHKKDLAISSGMKKMKKTLELDTENLDDPKFSESGVEDPFPAQESVIVPSFSYSKASSIRSDNSYTDSKDNIKEIIKDSLVDIFQHTSVLIAALMIFFDPQLVYMDLIFTYILGVFILVASLRSIKENVMILMEAAPPDMDVNIIGYNLRQIPEVTDLHNLHIWKISPGKIALNVHLKAQKSMDLLWRISANLKRMGVTYSTIQIEEDINYENELICD